MRKLFIIHDSLTNKISFYHLILFVLSLPFDRLYSEVILISFAIHTAIHLKKSSFQRFPLKHVLLLQSIFLLTLIASVHTVNPAQVFKEWEKQLAIFLFPLLLAITPLDLRKYKNDIVLALATSCVLTIIYLEFDALHIMLYRHLPLPVLFSDRFINRNFSFPIGIHPTYLAMYVALSIVSLLSFLMSTRSGINKIACGLSVMLLSISLLQLGAKSVLFAFLFLMMLSPFFLVRFRRNRKLFLLPALMLTLTLVTIYEVNGLKKRFILNLVDDVTKDETGKTKDEYRIVRWRAAIDLIKQSPVVGYGTGSEIGLLKKTYFERRLYNSFINELNTHNQYLSLMIKGGLIGVLVFLFTLFFGFSVAIKRSDFVMFSFVVIVAVVSFSENILEVNKGIFYYSFFFSLFVFAASPEVKFAEIDKQPYRLKKRFYNKEEMFVS